MNDLRDEQVGLLDRMNRIVPSSRDITAIFDGTASGGAWPDELTGIIVNGLTDAEAVVLFPSGRDRAELYVTNRVSRDGNPKRYLLADLQREAPGRFLFKATRDFDLSS